MLLLHQQPPASEASSCSRAGWRRHGARKRRGLFYARPARNTCPPCSNLFTIQGLQPANLNGSHPANCPSNITFDKNVGVAGGAAAAWVHMRLPAVLCSAKRGVLERGTAGSLDSARTVAPEQPLPLPRPGCRIWVRSSAAACPASGAASRVSCRGAPGPWPSRHGGPGAWAARWHGPMGESRWPLCLSSSGVHAGRQSQSGRHLVGQTCTRRRDGPGVPQGPAGTRPGCRWGGRAVCTGQGGPNHLLAPKPPPRLPNPRWLRR